jgi:hypothetical protein
MRDFAVHHVVFGQQHPRLDRLLLCARPDARRGLRREARGFGDGAPQIRLPHGLG